MLLGKGWFRHEEQCSQTTDGGEKQAVITFFPLFLCCKKSYNIFDHDFPFP